MHWCRADEVLFCFLGGTGVGDTEVGAESLGGVAGEDKSSTVDDESGGDGGA